jgi:ribosome-associated toxin RatA of RatAB toxin-antitoxin module
MAENEVTTVVQASVKQVFDLISDIPNYKNWVTSNSPFFIESKVTSENPVGLGTTYEDKLTLGKSVGKVVEYRPFERLVFEQKWYPESHVFAAHIEYHFEPLNGDTKISRVNNISPVEWAEPLKPGLTEMSRGESQRTCAAVKKTLERKDSINFKEDTINTVDNEVTTVVKAPLKQVFDLVSDIPNYTNWVTLNSLFFIESKVTSEGPIGLGTTFEDKLTLGKSVGKVVEYQPFERLVFEQ